MSMQLLYISALVSKRLQSDLSQRNGTPQNSFAVQKFSHLLATGFVGNDVEVTSLSCPPIHLNKGQLWVNEKHEIVDGINYRYVPFINIAGVKHIIALFYTFLYVLSWGISHRRTKVIVCDVLNISVCIGAFCASKILRIISVGVVTDMPGLMVNSDVNKNSILSQFITRVNKSYISNFSSYVLLTEQMNKPINIKNRPYIIMEGLVDNEYNSIYDLRIKKQSPRTVIYAGGLYARYGLKTLCESFMLVPQQDVRLILYGSGPFVKELEEYYCKKDSRIIYRGVRPNEEVVKEEIKATLLINPRPTTEEFTQYSFPSKNMEYMVSGTPLLTTKLPGMPEEYYPYVYLFDNETVEGFAEIITEILDLPASELVDKGLKGKSFVLKEKNNIAQTARILSLVKNCHI